MAIGLALFVGCVGPTRVETTGDEAGRATVQGAAVRVCVRDDGRLREFECTDGVHWSDCGPPLLGRDLVLEESANAGAPSDGHFRVTRDFTTDVWAPPHWRVWQRDGISWRLVATLPDDVSALGGD